jgi:hypothetical protein
MTVTVPDNNIPLALEAICLRALEKAAKDRYPDVQSMMEPLREYHAA